MSANRFKLIVIDNETGLRMECEFKNFPTADNVYWHIITVLALFSAHKCTVRLVDTTFDFILNEKSVVNKSEEVTQ